MMLHCLYCYSLILSDDVLVSFKSDVTLFVTDDVLVFFKSDVTFFVLIYSNINCSCMSVSQE